MLCAGEPDTPEIAAEVRANVETLRRSRSAVVWIEEMLPRPAVIQILSHARVFVCPSVYEPFGIVNLEAMACGIPVVASAVGGIPEIVLHEQTGLLVPLELGSDSPPAPRHRAQFARGLADAVNRLARDAQLSRKLGAAGRARVEAHYAWSAVGRSTAELYQRLLDDTPNLRA